MLAEIGQAQRQATAESLGGGATVPAALMVVEGAAARLQEQLKRFPSPRRLACKPACPWCCYSLVSVTAPEAIALASYVQTALPRKVATAIGGRVARTDDRTRGLDVAERRALRLPCPLLVERRCVAYPVRPLFCRAWHSFSAGACLESWKRPGSAGVLVIDEWREVAAAIFRGVNQGAHDVGLSGRSLELSAAVRLVLDDPTTVGRWLAGEDAFAPAKAPPRSVVLA